MLKNANNLFELLPTAPVKSQLWLNIGYELDALDELGNTSTKFIGIPVGIPMDSMEDKKLTSNNKEYNMILEAQNCLLKQIREQGMKLKPGESVVLSPLSCELRRINEIKTPNLEKNPYIHKIF